MKDYSTEIFNHIESKFGIVTGTHYDVTDGLPVNLHVVYPTQKSKHYTLITSGLSQYEMPIPSGIKVSKRAELILMIPDKINFSEGFQTDMKKYWPIQLPMLLTKQLHHQKDWIIPIIVKEFDMFAHILKPHTKFAGVMFYFHISKFRNLFELKIDQNISIWFYILIPLFKEEIDFAYQNDPFKLYNHMSTNKIEFVMDINRINVGLTK